jgi:hypothetical protein
MKDVQAHLEKLRTQVAECELIRDQATDPQKRELFARLAAHLKILAEDFGQGTRAAGTTSQLEDWLNSQGLKPPD